MSVLPSETTRRILRLNALATGLMSLGASAVLLSANFPFPKELAKLSMGASVFYFLYFALFDRICVSCYRQAGILLSQIGVLVVTGAVYYTGGIVSPFAFLYFMMLIAEAVYGLDNPYTMPASVAGYVFVVSGYYFGFLPNPVPWSAEVYTSPLFVLIIAGLVVGYLVVSKGLTTRIIANLRAKLEREAAEKDALIRKFSELNSTTQLGVLAHRIAHDLRGPIASVSGYIELELAGAKDPEQKETLRGLGETVNNMVETLHGITRFGKPGGASCEKIHLADFIKDLVGIASFSPAAKGIRFEVVPEGGNGLCVSASRSDLQQAVFNVLKNAVEAVGDNAGEKKVQVALAAEGADVKMTVSDNGPGIAEETLKNIFRKSVTTKQDGTGVGLLITRDLLLRNRGELKLLNRPEGGLAAVISLPRA